MCVLQFVYLWLKILSCHYYHNKMWFLFFFNCVTETGRQIVSAHQRSSCDPSVTLLRCSILQQVLLLECKFPFNSYPITIFLSNYFICNWAIDVVARWTFWWLSRFLLAPPQSLDQVYTLLFYTTNLCVGLLRCEDRSLHFWSQYLINLYLDSLLQVRLFFFFQYCKKD